MKTMPVIPTVKNNILYLTPVYTIKCPLYNGQELVMVLVGNEFYPIDETMDVFLKISGVDYPVFDRNNNTLDGNRLNMKVPYKVQVNTEYSSFRVITLHPICPTNYPTIPPTPSDNPCSNKKTNNTSDNKYELKADTEEYKL